MVEQLSLTPKGCRFHSQSGNTEIAGSMPIQGTCGRQLINVSHIDDSLSISLSIKTNEIISLSKGLKTKTLTKKKEVNLQVLVQPSLNYKEQMPK